MKALILIGGEGTRLRPLTYKTLKCMVPIAGRPFIEYQFAMLKKYGITEAVLSVCYMPAKVKKAVGDGKKYGMKIRYGIEKTPLGTAGAIKNCEKLLDDTTVIMNGDILTGFDLGAIISFHEKSSAVATIALHEVQDPSAYGLVLAAEDGRVKSFIEKPKDSQPGGNWINAGLYVFSRKALEMIPAGRQVSVERETFPLIIGKTSGLFASRQTGYWIDIGKLDKYRQANFDVLGGVYEPPFGAPQQGGVLLGRKTAFSDGVSVAPPFIAGEKCSIGRSAMLASSIIWDGVKVGAKAVIKNSIVGHKCVIGEGAVVEDAVLRDGTRVNGGTMIKGENK